MLLLAGSFVSGVLPWTPSLRAQQPSAQQVQEVLQQAQQSPRIAALIRDRLLESGLTPDQIRARLQASGYSANMLDAYLPGIGAETPTAGVTPETITALGALGIDQIPMDGLEQVPVDTGVV